MSFADHFSTQASHYAAARPHYPPALFDHLLALVGERAVVWGAACGSGQATIDLALRFDQVYATEPSAAALALAPALPNVDYALASAEASGLAPASVDLVVVAQAMHWFELPAFFAEVDRLLRPGGVLAVWCYQDVCLPDELTPAYRPFAERIEASWPPQRALIDDGYAGIDWPYAPLEVPHFELLADWPLTRLLEYFRSYSAVARYRQTHGVDPVVELEAELGAAWGDPQQRRRIEWPLRVHLRKKQFQ